VLGVTAPFIVVTGGIGTGKSTLVRRLADHFCVPGFPERPEANPFFGPPDQNPLQAELWFLNESVAACRSASTRAGGVVERVPAEHLEIFATHRFNQGWLTRDERALLDETYAASGALARPPDLLIHLELGVADASDRVRTRRRAGEEAVDVNYLTALDTLYEGFVRRWVESPVLRVYSAKLDFRDNEPFKLLLVDIEARLHRSLPVVVNDGGTLPTRAYPGDAGLDLASAIDAEIPPLDRLKVPTGVAMHIPEGHVGLVVPRSGYAVKHGITHLDGPGIIDSGYRDQVHFLLYNTDRDNTFHVKVGDRLGQIVVVPFAYLEPQEVTTLTPTVRENRGFGSSSS
jgi:dUTP pyrophosphatase